MNAMCKKSLIIVVPIPSMLVPAQRTSKDLFVGGLIPFDIKRSLELKSFRVYHSLRPKANIFPAKLHLEISQFHPTNQRTAPKRINESPIGRFIAFQVQVVVQKDPGKTSPALRCAGSFW